MSDSGEDGRSRAEDRLKSAHILILEDDMIIGLDLEETLAGFGAGRVTLVSSVAAALETIAQETVTVALLDLSLSGGETSVPAAERLFAENVPFAFLTGYSDPPGIPPDLTTAPVLGKPLSTAALRDALLDLLGRDG